MQQRFFINPEWIKESSISIRDKGLIHQLLSVLRFQKGEECIFLDNLGFEYHSKITAIDKHQLQATILEKIRNTSLNDFYIHLFQALPKQISRFELVLQKGTELGVNVFTPLITERTERRQIGNLKRLNSIIKEAAEQSERGILPKLEQITALDSFFENPPNGQNFFFHPKDGINNFGKVIDAIDKKQVVNLFIGPEGGFSENEALKALQSGFILVGMGKLVLRLETAAIVAVGRIVFD